MLIELENVEGFSEKCHLAFSNRVADLGQLMRVLEKQASKFGQNVNTSKSKLSIFTVDCTLPNCIIGQNIEGVKQFDVAGRVSTLPAS